MSGVRNRLECGLEVQSQLWSNTTWSIPATSFLKVHCIGTAVILTGHSKNRNLYHWCGHTYSKEIMLIDLFLKQTLFWGTSLILYDNASSDVPDLIVQHDTVIQHLVLGVFLFLIVCCCRLVQQETEWMWYTNLSCISTSLLEALRNLGRDKWAMYFEQQLAFCTTESLTLGHQFLNGIVH